MTASRAPRFAVIDVGTNAIRLVVARAEPDGDYRVLARERRPVRLGTGLARFGRIADDDAARALDVIGDMRSTADGLRVRALRAVATSAVREASNGRWFRAEAFRRHGVRLEAITARDEARLAFQSAAFRFDLVGWNSAVVDIGGGSVEVVFARGTAIRKIRSVALGAVRLTERYVRSDPLRRKDWKVLRDAIDRDLEAGIGPPPFPVDVMIGSGGTFTTLARMARAESSKRERRVHGRALARNEVRQLLSELRAAPLEARLGMRGLRRDRADIIVAGAAVVHRLARQLGWPKIRVNGRGIRDGLLLSIIAQEQPRATRR